MLHAHLAETPKTYPSIQDVYDQLEAKVQEMIASGNLDEKRQVAYQSFLFIIV